MNRNQTIPGQMLGHIIRVFSGICVKGAFVKRFHDICSLRLRSSANGDLNAHCDRTCQRCNLGVRLCECLIRGCDLLIINRAALLHIMKDYVFYLVLGESGKWNE